MEVDLPDIKEEDLQVKCKKRKKPCKGSCTCKAKKLKRNKKAAKLIPSNGDIMVVVLDHDANQGYLSRNPQLFPQVIKSMRQLCRRHLKKRKGNDVAILGCSSRAVNLVFSARQHYLQRAPKNLLTALKRATKKKLKKIMKRDLREIKAGGLTESHGKTQIYQTIGKALAYIMARRRQLSGRVNAKIILMTGSDLPGDGPITNIRKMLQAAQNMQVVIDVFSLDSPEKPLLLRATEMTKGNFYEIDKYSGLKKKIKAFY